MRKEDCYFLGKITRRHGLRGNVILKLDTDTPEFYNKLESIFVEINGLLVPFFIKNSSWSKSDSLNITFNNISEQLVEQTIGKDVYLPLATLPPLSGKQFYYHEVKGFNIMDENEINYGIVESVNDQTAQHYFILNFGEKEVIVPIIKDWILEVNREQKFIKMQMPEGLLDVFLTESKNDEQ